MRCMLATVVSLSSLVLFTACEPSPWQRLAEDFRNQHQYCGSLSDREDRVICFQELTVRRGMAAQALMGNAALFNTMGERMRVEPVRQTTPAPAISTQPRQCQLYGNQVFCQ